MPERPHLTDRDREILIALTHRVRVLTIGQIGRTWWTTSATAEQNAAARLKLLQREKLIRIERVPAHPELPLSSPALAWSPGESQPDFGAVSYVLQSRWNQHPVATPCVSATVLSVNMFDGYGGRPPRQVERTHDIHVAAVYLLYLKRYGTDTSAWTFEDKLRREHRRRGERLPDVIFELGRQRKAVEFGGAYPKTKLEVFHSYCDQQNLPYEVW